MCLRKDLRTVHAHSEHTVVMLCFSPLPKSSKQWTGTQARQWHRTEHVQKARARQWAFSNLVSDELQRISKRVSAAEVALRVKAVHQGRQGGFLKGNRRGAEPQEMDPKQLSFKNKVFTGLNNCVKLDPVRSGLNNNTLWNSLERKVYL